MWAGVRQGVSTGSAVAAEAVAVVCFSLFVTRWPRAATLWKQKLVLRLDLGQSTQNVPRSVCPTIGSLALSLDPLQLDI